MIWYDVSGLYNWKGSFTGIQRVVYNLAEYLEKDNKAKFFIYKHGNFIEVSFDELRQRLAARTEKIVNENSSGGQGISIATLRHHGVIFAKSVITGSRVEAPMRAAYKTARSGYRVVTKSGNKMTHHHSPFKTEDTVIVVDGNWQFSGFAESLVAAKKEIKFKLVHFVHDIVAIKNPALANKGADKIIGDYFKEILPSTDQILAISKSTENDVKDFLTENDIAIPKIHTITLGSDIHSAIQSKKPDFTTPKEFILSVSTVEVRKNYLLLYYAYKQALVEGIDLPHLIIVGKKGWMAEEAYNLLTKDPEVRDKITVVSGIGDDELEWLYANCLFTVFPSFYEGWGLPIAEALAHGKCCLSSNTSSMPEVGGDLVVYTSPYDPRELVQKLNELASDDKLRAKREARIKSEYHSPTWKQSGDQLVGYLKELL